MRALAVFLPLLIAYGSTWPWLWSSWNFREAYYAHGPLVVGLALLAVLASRAKLAALPSDVDPRGWYLLGPGLLLHLAGAALLSDSLSAVSLVLSVPGAVLLGFGAPRFRRLLPVLGLLPFVIPMPIVVTGRLAFELKELAVTGGLTVANLFGAGATRTGAEIMIPGQAGTLLVADPCSGLRSMVALITLGYCLAFFLGEQRGARRWIILLLAAPVAIASNALRIGAICVIARHQGVHVASTTGHDIASAIAWVLDLAILLGADALLTRRQRS